MKKMIFVLAMLLTAATAYTQTSRKPANNNTARDTKERHITTTRTNESGSFTANTRRSDNTNTTETRTVRTNTNRTENHGTDAKKPVRNETTTPRVTRQENNVTERPTASATTRVNNESGYHRTPGTVHRENTERATTHRNAVVYESPRVYRERHNVVHHYNNPPANREYRSVHYVYRRPVNYTVYWTPDIHRHFIEIYPMVPYWYYEPGYRIEMISAYDALYYRGDVMTVYGQVYEVFYSYRTDEYFLYFGAYYPYHDFTVVIPGYLARKYSHRPERFFNHQCMAVTGLITSFNDEPEIVVKRSFQINIY